MKRCDVIIPCYNNEAVITLTLQALLAQSIPIDWEIHIILIDDGSTDNTVQRAQDILRTGHWPYEILSQTHQGISQARNRGLDVASGEVVLFLNADIIVQAGTVAQHLDFHTQHPQITQAALGFIMWDPRVNPSPLMEWMMHGGPQNNFDAFLGQQTVDARHFFTAAHSSVKRDLLTDLRFAWEFTQYGWEDVELGRRLAEHGVELTILPHTLAWHHHHYSPAAIRARQLAVGQGLLIYQQRHPAVALMPSDSPRRHAKHALFLYTGASWLLDRMVTAIAVNYSWPWLFQLWTSWHFWEGVRRQKRL